MAKKRLSISLLASDRDVDTLIKCLDSLKLILDKVDGELIAVHTGRDEAVDNVLKKYCDRVVEFEWCNDFAKARNTGLRLCQGEWFMTIDDDEWFEDPTEIIRFFKYNVCNKYNSASYVVRNYSNLEGSAYGDSKAIRIVRITSDTRYTGRVHESIEPVIQPQMNFKCYAHHYGYAFATEEDRDKHRERNISILLGEVEDNPKDIRLLAHLVNEYEGAEDIKNLPICEAVLGDNTYERDRYYAWIARTYVVTLYNIDRYEEAVDYVVKTISEEYINSYVCTYIAYLGVVMAIKLQRYEDAVIFGQKYYDSMNAIEQSPNHMYEDIMFSVDAYTKDKYVKKVALYYYLSQIIINKDDSEEFYTFLDEFRRLYMTEYMGNPDTAKYLNENVARFGDMISQALDRLDKEDINGYMNMIKAINEDNQVQMYRIITGRILKDLNSYMDT